MQNGVANYKAILVSDRNGFVLVSLQSIFMLCVPGLENTKWHQKNVKGNLRFLVLNGHVLVSLVPENSPVSNSPWPLNKSTDNAFLQG